MPTPELPVLLSQVLSASGMAYAPHSRSATDGQVTLVGQLLRPGLSPMDVVIYASEDMEAFGLHLWPASQEEAPAQDAPNVLFEVVEEWTFIQPVMFRLFPIEALALVTQLDGRTLTLPGETPVPVLVPDTLILQAGGQQHDLYNSRPYRGHQERGLLLHWKALANFTARIRLTAGRA